MKTLHKLGLAAAAMLASTGAQASTTLTFDNLFGQYGDGAGLGPRITSDGQTLTYGEGAYRLTLHTFNSPNPAPYYGAHIGDGTGASQTFNWHDDGDNLQGAYVTLSRADGLSFSLKSFEWTHYGTDMTVSATGYSPLTLSYGGGSATPNFNNVFSVSFSSDNYSDNGLDNLVLQGVPEPASWALMIGGFGAIGMATRRRRRTSVSFA